MTTHINPLCILSVWSRGHWPCPWHNTRWTCTLNFVWTSSLTLIFTGGFSNSLCYVWWCTFHYNKVLFLLIFPLSIVYCVKWSYHVFMPMIINSNLWHVIGQYHLYQPIRLTSSVLWDLSMYSKEKFNH